MIVSSLTPPGKAAIATIALRGAGVWSAVSALFEPSRGALPPEPIAGRYWFGRFGIEQRDEVVLAVRGDGVEIHCHGGSAVVEMLQQLLIDHGATPVRWEQLFERESLISMLVHAPTLRTANILLDQLNGAWRNVRHENATRLRELIHLGRHLVEPWKVVIAGAPNVGKSSLVNALAGYTRSIVDPTPGTTRDVVTTQIAIDGWPIELCDTAGIRDTASDLERQGIERTLIAAKDANLHLWILDGAAAPVFPKDAREWHFVINKIDLPAAWLWDESPATTRVSAQTRAGIEELCAWISKQLVPAPPSPGEAVPCLPEQIEWMRLAFEGADR